MVLLNDAPPSAPLPARRLGLTGGIGSGKSTVARWLADLGAWVVDTDAISRSLTGPDGGAMLQIRELFGAAFIGPDGALDRPRMRDLVFRDPTARRRLEGLLHPLIGAETRRLAGLAMPGQAVIYDVPLLVESGRWPAMLDQVMVIDCQEETQVERVMQRSGMAAAEIRRIMAQQAPRPRRLAAADLVLYNDGLTLDELKNSVTSWWSRWHRRGL